MNARCPLRINAQLMIYDIIFGDFFGIGVSWAELDR